MDFGVDFGQKVDLTASIRNILRNYPEGTAILKELVQNADDAGARKVSFCLDCRRHGTASLAGPALGQFQGMFDSPALLVYNDAMFTEDDFKSIQRIGDSIKKTEETKAKIGRFGIGFNSVYHITELPSFVSSTNVVLLDPQARFLPNVNPANPGKMVNFLADPSILTRCQDQFDPYLAYGLLWAKPYSGTIFRFPLRTPVQAETSMLSKRAMSSGDVSVLLAALQKEASAMLLFLKSVESIEIMNWSAEGTAPTLIYCAEITNSSRELQQQRLFVGSAIRQSNATAAQPCNSELNINPSPNHSNIPVDFSLKIKCRSGSDSGVIEHWEVCNQLGGPAANAIANNAENSFLRLVPWAGVAACVNVASSAEEIKDGLAYCFLPLPVRTGLPIMVNGFFELSSNRRDVWQSGPDMTGDGRTRAAWNVALMSDVISPSYCRLLLRLKELLGFTERFQNFWPSDALAQPWSIVGCNTLMNCRSEKLLYQQTKLGTAPWILSHDVTPFTASSWINCSEAVLLPGGRQTLSIEDEATLAEVLVSGQCPFVNCTPILRDILINTGTCGRVADAAYVRKLLCNSTKMSGNHQYVPLKRLCGFLLRYCTSDISLSQLSSLVELDGLVALPLSLPHTDGRDITQLGLSTGSICIYSTQQLEAIDTLTSMGFPASSVHSALSKHSYNVDAAMEFLMEPPHTAGEKDSVSAVYILCSDAEELQLFSPAKGILIDRTCVYPNELKFLTDKRFERVSNVKSFHASLTCDILRMILPHECFSSLSSIGGSSAVLLNGKHSNGMTAPALIEFISKFWAYCKQRSEVVAAIAENVSVVPTRSGKLLPLSRLSYVLFAGDMPEIVQAVMEQLGLHILSTDIIVDAPSMPASFWDYVYPASRSALLQALHSALGFDDRAVFSCFSAVSPTGRKALLSYLSSCEPIRPFKDVEIKALRSLPVYCAFNVPDTSDLHGKNFFSLNHPTTVFQTIGDKERLSYKLFPSHFVRYNDVNELALLRAIDVPVLSRLQYFREHMIPRVSLSFSSDPDLVIKDCLEMLQELPVLADLDKSFVFFLKNSAFVPSKAEAGTGNDSTESASTLEATLYRPCDLYDPRDEELKTLLKESSFPAIDFQRDDILVYLTTLGIRNTLDWAGIIKCARDISDEGSANISRASIRRQRGESLLKFLDHNANSLLVPPVDFGRRKSTTGGFSLKSMIFGSRTQEVEEEKNSFVDPADFFAILNELEWIPVMLDPVEYGMPWRQEVNELSGLASPSKSRPYKDAWLCSASMSLCKFPIYSSHLLKALGWSKPLHHIAVAKQLRELAVTYEENRMTHGAQLQDLRERITALIPNLYQILNQCAATPHANELLDLLGNASWIWVGDMFVPVSRVAFMSSINIAPYLYLVPQDLSVYTHLLNAFGVRQTFSSRDYISVLERMAHEVGACMIVETNDSLAYKRGPVGSPLTEAQLDLAVSLITQLNSDGADATGLTLKNLTIYLPDQQGYLTLSSNLVIDDVPWLSGPEYTSIRTGIQFLHNNIANKFAAKIGIKSLRMLLVDRSVEQIFQVADSQMEAFGQAESLTSRLKTILDMYPDGNPILSELIQNADDAGASVVRILIDENNYDTVSLLNPSMAPLQGPSLLVGNDAQFSESDYKSLARIGQGSKLDKLSATGRFGLGFNSVYHLTDTPSILSGESLVIFDPHTTYVPGATLSQPGLRLRFQGSSMKSTFPDQFSPYAFFGCNMYDSYPGTLFRFPLRDQVAARKSEISKRSYSLSDVDGLLSNLSAQLANHLLFLRSVSTIELYRCAAGERTPTLIKRAHSIISNKEVTKDQTLMRYFDRKSTSTETKNEIFSRDNFYDALLAIKDEDLPTTMCTVRIDVRDESNTLLEDVEYLVVSGLRGGSAKLSACDPGRRHLKLVPFGGVAVCVSKVSVDPESSTTAGGIACLESKCRESTQFPPIQGQAFCFLPLPVKTKLPIHVNAYFELSSNRRDIWKADDTVGDSRVRGLWNDSLMREVIAPLYATLIGKVKSKYFSSHSVGEDAEIAFDPLKLLSLLPCPVPQDNCWQIICTALFPLLKAEEIMWCRGERAFIPLSDSIIISSTADDNKSSSASSTASDMVQLERLLIEEMLPIVSVPSYIFQDLIHSGCVRDHVSPLVVRSHFKNLRNGISHPSVDFFSYLSTNQDEKSDEKHTNVIQKKRNAAFLLSYCISDLQASLCSPNSAEADEAAAALFGLPLVPTDGGQQHAMLQTPTDQPLYICSEVERRLLLSATRNIIAGPEIIGLNLFQLFSNRAFAGHFNVSSLSPVDVLKLLRQVLPSEWFWENTAVVSRPDIVTDEWLRDVWSYIIGSNACEIFEGSLPLLPVFVAGQSDGSQLLKLKSGVPMLHMMFRENMSSVVMECLGSVGLYVYNPTLLGGLSFSPELSRLLCPATNHGFVEALVKVGDKSIQSSNSDMWSAEGKEAVRNYLLDAILPRCDDLSAREQEVLRDMGIWRSTTGCEPRPLSGGDAICDICLPPTLFMMPHYTAVVDKLQTSDSFVALRCESDRALYKKMGVNEPSGGNYIFYIVLPTLASDFNNFDKSLLDAISLDILSRLNQLETDCTGLSEKLKNAQFVKNGAGGYSNPSALYDPTVPHMTSLLPDDAFPSCELYGNDSNVFASLRSLGMKVKLTCDGVLRAAEAIHNSNISEGTDGAARFALLRSRELLKYMDNNVESLLSESDPDFLRRWVRRTNQSFSGEALKKARGDDSDDEIDDTSSFRSGRLGGGKWGDKMRSLQWVPVLTSPGSVHAWDKHLPWPSSLHRLHHASGISSVLPKNRWLCSCTHRILEQEVQSPLLSTLMGWDKLVPGNSTAQQLLFFVDSYQTILSSGGGMGDRAATFEYLFTTVPRLYEALVAAMESEQPKIIEIWARALKNKPVVWIGSQFVEPSRVAFEGLSSIDTEPFLYTVKGELINYSVFLKAIGVRDRFDVSDISNILRELHSQFLDIPLPNTKLDMCVGLVNILVRLTNERAVALREAIQPLPVAMAVRADDGDQSFIGSEQKEHGEIHNEDGDPTHVDFSDDIHWKTALNELGVLFIPDSSCILAPTQALCFDDAPWISGALYKRAVVSPQGKMQFRFVSKRFDNNMAKLLGVKSLREQFFAGDDVVCPSASDIKSLLAGDSCVDALGDLLGVADELEAEGVHVMIDCTTYPSESLIHPGLLWHQQGPALIVYYDGIKFESEMLSQMFASTQCVPNLPYLCKIGAKTDYDGDVKKRSSLSSGIKGPDETPLDYLLPRCGKRLASAFSFTDCLQILSGDYLYIYDPTGNYIFGTHNHGTNGATPVAAFRYPERQRAQRCKFTGKEGADFQAGFPDQLSPYLNLKFGHHSPVWNGGSLKGTVLRMPLRVSKSSISDQVFTDQTILDLSLHRARPILEGLLLFGLHVKRGSALLLPRGPVSTRQEELLISMELISASASRKAMKQFLSDNAWKKSSSMLGFSLFKSYVPAEDDYRVGIFIRERKYQDEGDSTSDAFGSGRLETSNILELQDDWLVLLSMGQARLRDLVNRTPFADLNLIPFISLAIKISLPVADEEPCHPSNSGYFFCGGCSMGLSGLPFHLSGTFLQDPQERGIPLPRVGGGDNGTKVPSRATPVSALSNRASSRALSRQSLHEWNTASLKVAMELLCPKGLIEIVSLLANQNASIKERNLLFIYRQWPYLPRAKPYISEIVRDVKLLPLLSKKPLFLCRGEFLTLDHIVLSYSEFPLPVLKYLQSFINLSEVPPQIAKDMILCQVKFNSLSPAKLREFIKPDRQRHCMKLKNQYHILLPILRYVISDLNRFSTHGDSVQRTTYRDIAGCPLLPMSDGCIRAFPSQSRDSVVFVTPALHCVLPQLRNLLIHPTALSDMTIFEQNIFLDTLFIGKLSPQFLQDNLHHVLPTAWKRCQFVECPDAVTSSILLNAHGVNSEQRTYAASTGIGMYSGNGIFGDTRRIGTITASGDDVPAFVRSGSNSDRTTLPPSDLLIYLLWKDIIAAAGSRLPMLLEGVKEWPLLPVVVGAGRSKRLFASPTLLPLLLMAPHTENEDAKRAGLVLEELKLSQEVVESADREIRAQFNRSEAAVASSRNLSLTSDWSWCATEYRCLLEAENFIVSSNEAEIHDLREGCRSRNSQNTDGPTASTINEPNNAADTAHTGRNNSTTAIADHLEFAVLPRDHLLIDVLEKMYVPFLDGSIFEEPPVGAWPSNSSTPLSFGRTVLSLLHTLHVQGSFVHECKLLMSTMNNQQSYEINLADEPTRLLQFEVLNVDERRIILQEILRSHNNHQLSAYEIDMLKTLPLFTCRDGNAVSIAQCSAVYWCSNAAVLEGLSISSGRPDSASAVILYVDESLEQLYRLMGAEQLTPAVAVRRFTLPALNQMVGKQRVEIMRGVAQHWAAYRDDAELVQLLKSVAFVPSWRFENAATMSATSSRTELQQCEVENFGVALRCPNQLFSWTNGALMEALQGESLPNYFPPREFREATWHALLIDLGMVSEIDKDSMIRLATDIQNSLVDSSDHSKKLASERGRHLLHYALDDNRLFFDTDLARRLGKIRFVPVEWPASVEPGGAVQYTQELCRFDQTVASHCGHLAFTLLPVLAKDFSPPQNFYSALGINASPSVDIVLRHLKNITVLAGETLDRWNSQQFPLLPTFSAIYSYIFDKWRDIPASTKDALRVSNLIPIGHYLARPSRVFFRLSEDLSPFMHELPRIFGAHETFLKEVGVRERPSPGDYIQFLTELASESGGGCLNPNELKAVIAIVQAIISQADYENSGPIYVPDESGILRSSRRQLYNDNGWLRGRLDIGHINENFNMFILHPLILKETADSLGINSLSSVFLEQLASEFSSVAIENESTEKLAFQEVLSSRNFAAAMLILEPKCLSMISGVEPGLKANTLRRMLSSIEIRCLQDLRVRIVKDTGASSDVGSDVIVQDGMPSLCFVDIGNTVPALGVTIFINYGAIKSKDAVITPATAIALGLCTVLKIEVTAANLIATLLMAGMTNGIESIGHVLADLRIGRDYVTDQELLRGTPGVDLLPTDVKLLELKPFRSFRIGEIVACNKSVISGTSSAGTNFIYAMVVEIGDPGNGGLRKLTLKSGDGAKPLITALSTDVYSFQSVRDGARSTVNTRCNNTLLEDSSSNRIGVSDTALRSKRRVDDGESVKSESHAVENSDVMAALSGLLSRAGVPMSMENEALVAKIVRLQSANQALLNDLKIERAHTEESRVALAKSAVNMRCQICVSNPVTLVLVPCGHTICADCAGQIPRNKCPFCRTVMREKVKFFVGEEESS